MTETPSSPATAHPLDAYEDRWPTRLGAWFPGQRVVYRGRDLLGDLAGERWMTVLLYGITGRMPNAEQVTLFEGIWTISVSYPDPRLWNNRVAALGGSARSTGALAVAAAGAVSEATIYGHRPIVGAYDFLVRTRRALDQGADLDTLVYGHLRRCRSLPGYGRPVTRSDERIAPLLALARRLGYDQGAHVRLAFDVADALQRGRRRMYMNVAALAAALAADQGFSAREYYCYVLLSFSAGIVPCYLDALEKPEGAFFPLRCSRLQYEGPARRSWS